jgi:hypothetical protein
MNGEAILAKDINTPVLTKNGISKLGDINIGEYIWSETGWVKVINKVCNGIKDVYKYHTNAGDFYSTDTHRILQNGEKIEVKMQNRSIY